VAGHRRHGSAPAKASYDLAIFIASTLPRTADANDTVMMILRSAAPSPFGRKVQIALAVLGVVFRSPTVFVIFFRSSVEKTQVSCLCGQYYGDISPSNVTIIVNMF
jgi:hypothetical protein